MRSIRNRGWYGPAMVVLAMAAQSAFCQEQGASAAADAGLALQVERPGALTRYEFSISGVHPAGQDLVCFVNVQDGKARAAWALRKSPDGAPPEATDSIDAARVVADGDRLHGKVEIRFPGGRPQGSQTYLAQLDVDLRRQGDTLSGPVTGEVGPIEEKQITIASDQQLVRREDLGWMRKGEWKKVETRAAGRAAAESALRAAGAFAADADWPCWIGPNQNFSATAKGHRLVDDLRDARLAWVSEQTPPGRCQVTRYGEANLRYYLEHGAAAGGSSSPILYQGRVYQHYVRPSGGEYDKRAVELVSSGGKRTLPLLWSLYNDDVILCCDAATGQTLWKAVLPKKGLYLTNTGLQGSTKRGAFTHFMCAGSGRVFARLSTHHTACLDARTGELKWAAPDGSGELSQVIDGVLVVVDRVERTTGLIGLEVETGKRLWAVPDAGTSTAVPLAWTHQGRTFVIAGGATGQLVCVEPRTGTVRWRAEELGRTADSMSLTGDHLVVDGCKEEKGDGVFTVHELTLDGPKRLWHLDPKAYPFAAGKNYPTGRGRHVFAAFPSVNTVASVDAAGGKVVSTAPKPAGKFGYSFLLEDRYMVQLDCSHGRTELDWFRIGPQASLERLGETWHTQHATTSGYHPVVMTHAIADGRIVIRGSRGLVCYDLRARPETR